MMAPKLLKPAEYESTLFSRMEGDEAKRHGFIGYLRGDYGRSGTEFWPTWTDGQTDLKTQGFQTEFDEIMNYLRDASQHPAVETDAFQRHCLQNMFRLGGTAVSFKVMTQAYSYYFRCLPQPGDCNLYCMAYDNQLLLQELPKQYAHPDFGGEFWRDTAASLGVDEATAIGGEYLKTQLKKELPPEEKQFCRAFFAAMYETMAGRADPAKLVYPYPLQQAKDRMEGQYYYDSLHQNTECAQAIGTALKSSNYALYRYNFELAAMVVLRQYGFPRVNAVLAHCIQSQEWDIRYSDTNKQWAKGFDLQAAAFESAHLAAHPTLVEDFTSYTRRLYSDLDAERFDLPGHPERGEVISGYEIQRAITFEDHQGLAIAAHPREGYVCWQFRERGGKREYLCGHYCSERQDAENNFIARIASYMSDGTQVKAPAKAPAPEQPKRKPRDRGER